MPTPTIAIRDIPEGTTIHGLAPIGVPWTGTKRGKRIVPDNWPRRVAKSEFVPCTCTVQGREYEIASH